MSLYNLRDQYIDDVLEAQQRELEELRKDPDEREEEEIKNQYREPERYTIKETLLIMGGAVGSGLLIASIFIGTMFLFLLFATQVWMK